MLLFTSSSRRPLLFCKQNHDRWFTYIKYVVHVCSSIAINLHSLSLAHSSKGKREEFDDLTYGLSIIWVSLNKLVVHKIRSSPVTCQKKNSRKILRIWPTSAFLKRGINKGLVEVTGTKVNRGASYGLEIPCNYHFYHSKSFIKKLQRLVYSLCRDGHLYHKNCCALTIHVHVLYSEGG